MPTISITITDIADSPWSAQIMCSTPGVELRYTVDGTVPCRGSSVHPPGQLLQLRAEWHLPRDLAVGMHDGNSGIPGGDRALSLQARAFRTGMAPSAVCVRELLAGRQPPTPAPPRSVDSPVDYKAIKTAVRDAVREELGPVKDMQADAAKAQGAEIAMLDAAQYDRESILDQQEEAAVTLDDIAAKQTDTRQNQAAIMSHQAAGTAMLKAIGERQDTTIGNQEDALLALAGLQELAEEPARVVLVIEPQVTAAVADMHRQTQGLLEADAVEREQQLELLMASTRAAQRKADE